MKNVIGVVFKDSKKIYYFDPSGYSLKKNTTVIVETERGLQFGKVEIPILEIPDSKLKKNLNKIVRIASKKDYIKNKKNIEDSSKALEEAHELANKLGLDMQIIDAEYTFDRNQLIFNFLADSRIDFRNLVKELAAIYKTRIELRQIGVRDKAKQIGGVGQCGRCLCCSTFLNDLDNVTINMVKNQNLTLNPNKINGVCGRLLCCLKYEDQNYTYCRKHMPKIGDLVNVNNEIGSVTSCDILTGKYKVLLKSGEVVEEEIKNGCC